MTTNFLVTVNDFWRRKIAGVGINKSQSRHEERDVIEVYFEQGESSSTDSWPG